ncbi:MAG: hypothetical protein HRT99_03375, partial [Mycoplasmatales bacterium]|nr:hypothetical protein [Mycoplasmatales bacterium]
SSSGGDSGGGSQSGGDSGGGSQSGGDSGGGSSSGGDSDKTDDGVKIVDIDVAEAKKKVIDAAMASYSIPLKSDGKNEYVFPRILLLNKSNNRTSLMPIKTEGLPSDVQVKYFSSRGEITDLSNPGIKDNDIVFVIVLDGNDKFITGHKYHVTAIGNENIPSRSIENSGGFTSAQYSGKLFNKSLKLKDIFRVMDKMDWGNSYKIEDSYVNVKSNIVGANKHKTAPTKMEKLDGVVKSNYKWRRNFYNPFIDPAMGEAFDTFYKGERVKNYANPAFIAKLKKYELLTIGFLSGETESGPTWSGNMRKNAYVPLINNIRKNGNDVVVSIGGAAGHYPWTGADPILFARQIEGIVRGLKLKRIDFDIEGDKLAYKSDVQSAAIAMSIVQAKIEYDYKMEMKKPESERDQDIIDMPHIDFTLTLPSDSWGLSNEGSNALQIFVDAGVRIDTLNGMTMMMQMGAGNKGNASPLDDAVISALGGLKNSIQNDYSKIGIDLSDEKAYQMIGTTIDIATDTKPWEVPSRSDLETIYDFAVKNKVGMLSYWSINNDDSNFRIHGGVGVSKLDANEVYDIYNKYNEVFKENNERDPLVIPNKEKLITDSIYNHYSITEDNSESNKTIEDLKELKANILGLKIVGKELYSEVGGYGSDTPKIIDEIDKIIKSFKNTEEKAYPGIYYSNVHSVDTLPKSPSTLTAGGMVYYQGHVYKTVYWYANHDSLLRDLENELDSKKFVKLV